MARELEEAGQGESWRAAVALLLAAELDRAPGSRRAAAELARLMPVALAGGPAPSGVQQVEQPDADDEIARARRERDERRRRAEGGT